MQVADELLDLTEVNEFRNPDFEKISKMLKNKDVFNGRNVFEVKKMEDMGFVYHSIGRRTTNK